MTVVLNDMKHHNWLNDVGLKETATHFNAFGLNHTIWKSING